MPNPRRETTQAEYDHQLDAIRTALNEELRAVGETLMQVQGARSILVPRE